jgi:hypothetical protein
MKIHISAYTGPFYVVIIKVKFVKILFLSSQQKDNL